MKEAGTRKCGACLASCAAALALTVQGQTAATESPAGHERVRIVAFGDSTTAKRGALAIYADLLQSELPAKGVDAEIINAGIGGHSTRMGRDRFTRDVLAHKPTLVIIQFGINDAAVDVWKEPPATGPRVPLAEYRANLEFFVDQLRLAKARVILMTPNPTRWTDRLRKQYGKPPYRVEDPDGFNVLLRDYAEAARQVAHEKKVELIDIYAAYEAFGAKAGQSMDDLLPDGMHPNAKGHRLAADLLLKTIPAMLKP